MKIRFTRNATAEIDEIFSYIARENPRAATTVIREVDRTIARLARYPKLGHLKYTPNVRMLPVARFRRYLVFYTIEATELVILSVRHSARRHPWEPPLR
jgi:toxin ParE1/3/4